MHSASDFAFSATPSACKKQERHLCFATYGGVVEVKPTSFKVNQRSVHIERVIVNQRNVIGPGGSVRAGSSMEFQYTL